ncbi:guanine nucleotide exchange factor [Anaeramoeba ignava]|uniref:Guanine nucleotide exchange factor n=1 Tax=Anaeramoeba ignava TaxID=1746090 RepID=A0A9Q0LKQ1_ANAIG|nr:guanine nucleotide exchange factor [Anaeramoeba ignava]
MTTNNLNQEKEQEKINEKEQINEKEKEQINEKEKEDIDFLYSQIYYGRQNKENKKTENKKTTTKKKQKRKSTDSLENSDEETEQNEINPSPRYFTPKYATIRCYKCGELGHIERECPLNKYSLYSKRNHQRIPKSQENQIPILPQNPGVSSLDIGKKFVSKISQLQKTQAFRFFHPNLLESTNPVELREKSGQTGTISRASWIPQIMRTHPDLLSLRERTRFFSINKSFSCLDKSSKTESEILSSKAVLHLVMQYLHHLGFHRTVNSITKQTNIKFQNHYSNNNLLPDLLRIAVQDLNQLVKMENNQIIENEEDKEVEFQIETLSKKQEHLTIWEEKSEGENILFTEETRSRTGSIRAATLNKLIENLTPELTVDLSFVKTFLLTYQSFTTPEILFQKLVERYNVPEEFARKKKIIQLRVVNVFVLWIQNYFSDFNPNLLHKLFIFSENYLQRDGYQTVLHILKTILSKKFQGTSNESEYLNMSLPEPKIPKNIFSPKLTLNDIDEEEIARQLTLYEFNIYKQIKPKELLNQAWNKQKLKHNSPNVIRLIERFNDLSVWIATSIISQIKLANRVSMIIKFIKIGEYLRTMNNFNTLMAVIAGLNSSAIFRLKSTWSQVPQKIYDIYQSFVDLMDSKSSYKNYRQYLKKIIPPCIPYLGIFLTDLTFTEDGNPDKIGNLINFFKRKLIYDVIIEIQQYQQVSYNFQSIHQIFMLITNFQDLLSEDQMFEKSLKIEPRKSQKQK